MGPADVAPWLEQVGDGLAKKVTIGLDAEISEVADCHRGCGCLGIVSKGPESAQGVGLVILFPLAIVSNGLVPTQRMPAVLRVIADWNPVSAVTAAARHLWGNPNPSATIQAWPMQHPVAASLLWSVALLAIFAPLATLLYRRRTTG